MEIIVTEPRPAVASPQRPSPVTPSALWILRILVRSGVAERLQRESTPLDVDIARALAIPELDKHDKFDSASLAVLARRLTEAEELCVEDDSPLSRNVAILGRRLALTRVERALLAFGIALETEDGLRECLGARPIPTARELRRVLQIALRIPNSDIVHALRSCGMLRISGLVRLQFKDRSDPPFLVMEGLTDALSQEPERGDAVTRFFARRAPKSRVLLDDFAYMGDTVTLVVDVLRGALRKGARGVNLLVHGKPGADKRAFACALAREVDAQAFEVRERDGDDDSAARRVASSVLAQRVLASTPRALLVCGDAETTFAAEPSWRSPRPAAALENRWVRRMMDRAPVPTLWLADDIEELEPATRDRFVMTVELRAPPRAVRAEVLRRCLGKNPVRTEWIARVTEDERLVRSVAERVGKVARLLGSRDPEQLESALERTIKEGLGVGDASETGQVPAGPTPYALRFLNTSLDVEHLARTLRPDSRGSICLYGAPGTGKTAFAQHLAKRLEQPLHVVSASTVLAKYVGETEQKLAEVFRRATTERGILFLDEIDGLLQDRSRAERTWEVTQVNELLTQIDTFPGLLLCATNLIDSLDAASLRRFALKIRFDALRPEQRWDLFGATVPGEIPDAVNVRSELARMDELTAGDFAAALRRLALLGMQVEAGTLLNALNDEWTMKRRTRRAISGFRSSVPGS